MPHRPLLLAIPMLLTSGWAMAQSCQSPKSCQIPPAVPEPVCEDPVSMAYQSEEGGQICETTVSSPVPALVDCQSFGGGMICEAWAQEISQPQQHLTYDWSVRVGLSTTQYQTGTYPYLNFSCTNGQSVQVTMTIHNGTYAGSSSRSYTCGDLTQ